MRAHKWNMWELEKKGHSTFSLTLCEQLSHIFETKYEQQACVGILNFLYAT